MKKMISFFVVAVMAVVCFVSCGKGTHTVEYSTWFDCATDLLHYATPVVEYSDYTGAVLIDTLKEEDFLLVSSSEEVSGGDTTSFLRCDLVNKKYLEWGISNQLVVKYLPKEVEYAGEDICLAHTINGSLEVKNLDNFESSSKFTKKIDLSTHSGQEYLDEFFSHADTLSCVVSKNGDVSIYNNQRLK